MPFACKDDKGVGRGSVRKNTNRCFFSWVLSVATSRTGVLVYSSGVYMPKLCFSSVSSPSAALRFSVVLTFFCALKHVCKKSMGFSTPWVHNRLTISSRLAAQNASLKMSSPVISGHYIIVLLAHAHKHKKNYRSTQMINGFWISHTFCIASNLRMSNCRMQMNESAPLRTGSGLFQQRNAVSCAYTRVLSSVLWNFLMFGSYTEYFSVYRIPSTRSNYLFFFLGVC